MKKTIITILATALACFCIAGTTLAFLVDKTEPIVNTFTAGNVNITLTETDTNADTDGNARTNSFKMIPGAAITKDPKVTVIGGSEKCWVFVRLTKADNFDSSILYDFDSFMSYEMADGWTLVDGETDVYYRTVEASAGDQSFTVIEGNTVSVKDTVTKDMIDKLDADANLTLTVTAYAVQYEKLDTVAKAWTQAKALDQSNP